MTFRVTLSYVLGGKQHEIIFQANGEQLVCKQRKAGADVFNKVLFSSNINGKSPDGICDKTLSARTRHTREEARLKELCSIYAAVLLQKLFALMTCDIYVHISNIPITFSFVKSAVEIPNAIELSADKASWVKAIKSILRRLTAAVYRNNGASQTLPIHFGNKYYRVTAT